MKGFKGLAILSFSLFVSQFSYSQFQMEVFDSVEYKQEIFVNGVANYSAWSIEKELLSKFYRGGVIDEAMKDASYEKHMAINRLGLAAGADLVYRNYQVKLFKNKNWGIQGVLGYQNFVGALYSKDLFGLAMYGNERYLGDTLEMSGTNMTMLSYQKLGFGFVDSKNKSSVNINLYNISERLSGDFRDFDLIQDDEGAILNMTMDGEFERTQSNNFNQGLGLGVDMDFRFEVGWYKNRTAHIQFIAKDVGFAYMNSRQLQYSFDTTINYTGLRFDDVFGDNAILNEDLDVLDTLGIKTSNVNSFLMMPGMIQLSKMVDENSDQKLQSFFGARMYATLLYSPYVFAGADYKANDWFNAGLSVSYGGFSKFKTGVYTNFDFNKIQFGMGTDNLIGLMAKRGNGESIYIRLRCKI